MDQCQHWLGCQRPSAAQQQQYTRKFHREILTVPLLLLSGRAGIRSSPVVLAESDKAFVFCVILCSGLLRHSLTAAGCGRLEQRIPGNLRL
jgi:hypothetical protein